MPINNNGSRNCDYCCAVCLWSKPSLVISLLHQGAAAFFSTVSAWHFSLIFCGGLGLRVVKRSSAETCGSQGGSNTAGTTLLQQQYIFSAGPGLWWCLCGHAQHGCVMNTSDWLRPRTWRVLNPRDVCSCKLRCFGMWLLFCNKIVSPLYCQCLLNLKTLIN